MESSSGEKSRSFVDDPGVRSFEGSKDNFDGFDRMPRQSVRGDNGSTGREREKATSDATQGEEGRGTNRLMRIVQGRVTRVMTRPKRDMLISRKEVESASKLEGSRGRLRRTKGSSHWGPAGRAEEKSASTQFRSQKRELN